MIKVMATSCHTASIFYHSGVRTLLSLPSMSLLFVPNLLQFQYAEYSKERVRLSLFFENSNFSIKVVVFETINYVQTFSMIVLHTGVNNSCIHVLDFSP